MKTLTEWKKKGVNYALYLPSLAQGLFLASNQKENLGELKRFQCPDHTPDQLSQKFWG